ncbi:class I SAM-dependent methyltransferase [Methanogenium organophilum]|uniref:Class I SAM-dependent methyltransferase n=1 Tax=Methanogenium organophilum TaxID=2199 RepID=A0A9X9S2A2_METOG|nr:class I SAM-dependent methyltransferase [Methanogenium organophilum]WAI00210.1 class I SAM-dependent methyltransferase [Methanogenium organophilum]
MTEEELVLGDVGATSLITLYCHAIETRSENPILSDPKSVEITSVLSPVLARSRDPLGRRLAEGILDPLLVVHIALRARRYDRYVRDFLNRFPEGVVVDIGCGLNARFLRTDNGMVHFYDLDLPDVITLKKRFFQETERYHMIASSVLDDVWMSVVSVRPGPFLFLAEGVFMYLEEEAVRSMVLRLRERFPDCELICEVVNALWVTRPLNRLVTYKMQRRLRLGKDAVFRFGIRRSDEMETWHPGIRFLDEWSYYDSGEKIPGWLKFFGRLRLFRYTQWTVHYLLE